VTVGASATENPRRRAEGGGSDDVRLLVGAAVGARGHLEDGGPRRLPGRAEKGHRALRIWFLGDEAEAAT
jgi:hypothetical protein